jgi:hypothetical protein
VTQRLRIAALVVAALTVSASAFAQSSLPQASPAVVVNPDGAETIGTVPMGHVNSPAVSPGSITVDFNDLQPDEVVAPDRYYKTLGLRIEIGPSSTTSGVVEGSFIGGPCDGTRSIKTEPFIGPSFLLRFPQGVTSVSLDAGDFGESDSDLITVKAFSDDALETLISIDIGFMQQGAPTGCVRLSVSVQDTIALIKAVEITSESSVEEIVGVSFFPNSIFIDNVSFAPAH